MVKSQISLSGVQELTFHHANSIVLSDWADGQGDLISAGRTDHYFEIIFKKSTEELRHYNIPVYLHANNNGNDYPVHSPLANLFRRIVQKIPLAMYFMRLGVK